MPVENSRRVVVAAYRDQHAHEIRGNSGMFRGQAERFAEGGLRRAEVVVERGGDGDGVGNPRRQRQIPGDVARILQISPRRPDLVAGKRHSTGAEQRFRPYRGSVLRQGSGFREVAFRAGKVAGAERDIGETKDRLRCELEAFGERRVLPASRLWLACGQGRGGDRQVAAQDIRAPDPVFRRLPGGATDHRNHRENRRARPHATNRRWVQSLDHGLFTPDLIDGEGRSSTRSRERPWNRRLKVGVAGAIFNNPRKIIDEIVIPELRASACASSLACRSIYPGLYFRQ